MIPEVNLKTPWPSIEFAHTPGQPVLIFFAGFPDDCKSGWGDVLTNLVKEEKYHVICLCMPEYQSNCIQHKQWGYQPHELLLMLRETIKYYVKDQKVNLVTHDWGAFFGIVYQNHFPELVDKLVLLDIGVGLDFSVHTVFVLLFYQFYFAISYIISQIFGKPAGTIFFGLFFILKLDKILGPCPNEGRLNRPRKELSAYLCYIYYNFWKMMITNRNVLKPVNPTCPVLFMYGRKKRILFHSTAFVDYLTDKGYPNKILGFDAGHWFQLVYPKEVSDEIRAFIPGISKKNINNNANNDTNTTKSPDSDSSSNNKTNDNFLNFIWEIPGVKEL